MPTTFKYTVKATLPIGDVTLDVDYFLGYPGSRWTPPESDEICVNKITDSNGMEAVLTDEQYEDYYDVMLEASILAHSAYLDAEFDKYAEEWSKSYDAEMPF